MRAYYNDHDPSCCAWMRELIKRKLIPDGEVDERSILDVEPADLRGFSQVHFFAGIAGWAYALRLAHWPDDLPVWTGSAPCQPFSTAGKQLSRDDMRHLSPKLASLVGACRPPVLFGEQVATADVFGKVAGSPRKQVAREPEWAWIDDLSDRLEASHYAVGASDLPAASIAAENIRQRTFFFAVRLADPDDEGLQGSLQLDDLYVQRLRRQVSQRHSAASDLAPFVRPWSAERGADGKVRPVPPDYQSGDYGLSDRVVRVRGYGNAINPRLAREFIRSSAQAITEEAISHLV